MSITMQTTDAFIKATQDQTLTDFDELVAISKKYRDETTKAHKQELWNVIKPKKESIFSQFYKQ